MGALIPNKNDLDFIFALLTNSDLNKKFSGSTIPHIYFKDYGKEFYLVPVLSEQYLVGRLFKRIDQLITLHQRKPPLPLLLARKPNRTEKSSH